MTVYKSIDKQNLISQREELESCFDINVDMLNEGKVTKYGVGINSEGVQYLTTATIPDPVTGGSVRVNPKNSLLIGLEALAYKYNLKEYSFVYNPDSRMRKLMAALMPDCDDVDIESIFYKRLLTRSCRRDDIRNCRSGIPYRACFSYIKKNRYITINDKKSCYTEEEISDIADMLYEEVAEPYIQSKKMTPVIREVISETVDVRLQAEYGWKFDYQQYVDMQLNEELITRIVKAFPENFKTLSKLELLLNYDAGARRSTIIGSIIKRPTTNPLLGNPAWRRMMEKELRHPFVVISENFLEDTLNLENNLERRVLITQTVSEFVNRVNNERLQQTSFIRRKANDRDKSINTAKDIKNISDFLYITLGRIEDVDNRDVYDCEKMEGLLLGDMNIDARGEEKRILEQLLELSGVLKEEYDPGPFLGIDKKLYEASNKQLQERIITLRERYTPEGFEEMMSILMPDPLDPLFGHPDLDTMAKKAGWTRQDVIRQEKRKNNKEYYTF